MAPKLSRVDILVRYLTLFAGSVTKAGCVKVD